MTPIKDEAKARFSESERLLLEESEPDGDTLSRARKESLPAINQEREWWNESTRGDW